MWDILWLLAAVFVAMWILGQAFNFTLGGLVHLLLVLAVISVLVRVIMGRRLA